MGIRIFAGMPPKKINDWIVEHYVPPIPPVPVEATNRYYNDSTTASPIDVTGTLYASDLEQSI